MVFWKSGHCQSSDRITQNDVDHHALFKLPAFVSRCGLVLYPIAHLPEAAPNTVPIILLYLRRCQIAGEMGMYLPVLEKLVPHQDDLAHDIRLGTEVFDFVFSAQVIEAVRLIDGIMVNIVYIIPTILRDDLWASVHVLQW